MDINEDLDDIRKFLGFCSQKDILYEEMTVEEHLRFIAEIKGVSPITLQSEIDYVIEKVGLQTERSKKTNQLSGGNKRKLSLGMAIVSGSKVIFLDEPTSGMDPITRRLIWDILKSIKNEGRTIILTTHHLDEADIIADKIGVMSSGKLLALGSSDFIKKKFGVGYILKFTPKGDDESVDKMEEFNKAKDNIKKIVFDFVPVAQRNLQQCSKECETFIVPFSHQNKFSELFKELELLQASLNFNVIIFRNIFILKEEKRLLWS